MKPLREDPNAPPGVAPLLEAAREVPDWTPQQQAALWRKLAASADGRARTPRRSPWMIAVPALAAFALTVLVAPKLIRRADPDPRAQLAARLHVEPAADAKLEAQGEVLALGAGTVTAQPGAHVRTPQLDIQVGAAHCRIQVAGDVTTLDVLDGEVRVRRGDGPELVLSGAARLRSDDPRLVAAATASVPPAHAPLADACAPLPTPEAKRSCYAQAAMGSGLAAQNALYSLGQLAREGHDPSSAVQYFKSYEQRYPDGALWPEAALGVLTARLEQGAWPEALESAEQYLARVPMGARAPEVRLIRANLLRERLGRTRAAFEAYRELVGDGGPESVRSEALFGEALAAQKLGLASDAREALERYGREFPHGSHAAEVARMRGP